MLVENGNYGAVAREAAVYENEKGNLVVCFNFMLCDQANELFIKGYASIAKADGTVNTKAIENLKSVFGWDGHDPFWLVDNDLSAIPVELVIENELGEDGKTYSRVKWINKPGSGGQQMPEMADRRSILTKYGAKFRALSGGTPVRGRGGSNAQRPTINAQRSTPKGAEAERRTSTSAKPTADKSNVEHPTSNGEGNQHSTRNTQRATSNGNGGPPRPAVTPALPGLPEVPKAPPRPTTAHTSTMEKCWQVLCEEHQGAERSALEKLWFDAIAELFPQKEQSDFGPADWGKLELKLADNVPY